MSFDFRAQTNPDMIRINELARELRVKAKVLIEYLPEIGVTEKKTHSSSIDNEHAELVRKHFLGLAEAEAAAKAEKKAKEAAAKAKPAAKPAPAPAAGARPGVPLPRPGAPAPAPGQPPTVARPGGAAPKPGVAPAAGAAAEAARKKPRDAIRPLPALSAILRAHPGTLTTPPSVATPFFDRLKGNSYVPARGATALK